MDSEYSAVVAFLPGGQSPGCWAPPVCMPVEAACWHLGAQSKLLWWEEVDNSQLYFLNRLLASILA